MADALPDDDPNWHRMVEALQAVADLPYNIVSKPISEGDAARRQEHIDVIVKLRGALLRTHDRRDVRIHIREARIKTTAALMERMMHDPPYNDLNVDAVLEVASGVRTSNASTDLCQRRCCVKSSL